MNPPSDYGANSLTELAARTEYEAWLLEAAYKIAESDLFPLEPDSVIYPIHGKPRFIAWLRSNIVIGDWRPGFLDVASPLILVTSFKVLDMLVEWILSSSGHPVDYRFKQKLEALEKCTSFPPVIGSRPWLRERIVGLYRNCEPLRSTIIHERHFIADKGEIIVSSSKKGALGPPTLLTATDLRTFARTLVTLLRYLSGSWPLNSFRERFLRHDLDCLLALHGMPSLGQDRPYHPTVRLFLPAHTASSIDLSSIAHDLRAKYPSNDCSFDLRVLVVDSAAIARCFLVPWQHLEHQSQVALAALDTFVVAPPDDVDPKDLV